jgi:hypothetical protein
MMRDLDRIYGAVVTRRLRAMGIRDNPIEPASPWQNGFGFAERLIGSIRRECLDHAIICGEARRVLKSYADYYNRFRTHRSLNKDAPVSRSVQRTGVLRSGAILADFITTGTHNRLRGLATDVLDALHAAFLSRRPRIMGPRPKSSKAARCRPCLSLVLLN